MAKKAQENKKNENSENNEKNNDTLTNKEYMRELRRLQAELAKLQDWVKYKGLRVIVVFEGRDAAGKGGTHPRDHRTGQPARLPHGGACPRRQTAKRARCTFSATCSIFRRPAKS